MLTKTIIMDMKLNIAIIAFVSFLYGFSTAQSWVLEISKFGGAPNADITQVLSYHSLY